MANYKAIFEQILMGYLASGKISLSGQSKGLVSLFILSGVTALAGFVFLGWGSFIWLEKYYSTDIALLAIGGATLLFSLLTAMSGWAVIKYRQYQFQKIKSDLADIFHEAWELADQELREPVNDNPKTAVLLASVAGFMTGKHL